MSEKHIRRKNDKMVVWPNRTAQPETASCMVVTAEACAEGFNELTKIINVLTFDSMQ